MSREHSKKWIQAIIAYEKNPNEVLFCPDCNEHSLSATPVVRQEKVTDLNFNCTNCNAYEIVSIANKYQADFYTKIFGDCGQTATDNDNESNV